MVSFLLKRAVFILAALAAAAPAGAQESPWRPLGPYGGNVTALTADPARSGTVYAATEGGVFKTADGGGSWTSLYPPAPSSNVRRRSWGSRAR